MYPARICTPNVYHENVHKPTFHVYLYIHSMYTCMYILCTPLCTFHIHSMYILCTPPCTFRIHSMYIPLCTFLLRYYVHFPEKCLLIHSRTIGKLYSSYEPRSLWGIRSDGIVCLCVLLVTMLSCHSAIRGGGASHDRIPVPVRQSFAKPCDSLPSC